MVADWEYADNNNTWQLAQFGLFAIITRDTTTTRWYAAVVKPEDQPGQVELIDQSRADTVEQAKQQAEYIIDRYITERFMKW